MISSVLFTILLCLLALFCFTAGIFFLKMNEKNLPQWEKLPRNRIAGTAVGMTALLCFIPNVKPVFSPVNNLYWMIPAALILGILCYLYLDHLFARGASGAMILLVHFLLSESFTADLKGRTIFSVCCFIAGTFAILTAAKPYWLRDYFRKMCTKRSWRLSGAVFCFFWSVCALMLFIQQLGKAF